MSSSPVLAVRGLNSKPSGPTRVPASASNLSLGYLRAFITLLVVAQHAVMTALAFLLLPRWAEFLGRVSTGANRRPILLFAIMIALSGAAYVPVAVAGCSTRFTLSGELESVLMDWSGGFSRATLNSHDAGGRGAWHHWLPLWSQPG